MCHHEGMNNATCKSFCRIFEELPRPDIDWDELVRVLKSLGGTLANGNGSRRRLALNGVKGVFHEPHPDPRMDKGAVADARDFLSNGGCSPALSGCICK